MRDAEQAIEKVLAGMREVDAPQGMEGRILRAIEERAAKRDSRLWRVWLKSPGYARFVAAGVVVAGLLLIAVAMPLMRRAVRGASGETLIRSIDAGAGTKNGVSQRLKPQVQGGSYGTAQAVPLSKANLSNANLSERRLGEAGLSEIASLGAPANPNTAVIEKGGGAGTFQDGRSAEGVPDYDALAVSEMLAPSEPAPPLPLTHQERLLAQVVHKGEPEALAPLRADVRAKQMEISKAEFEDFFEPPPVKDNE